MSLLSTSENSDLLKHSLVYIFKDFRDYISQDHKTGHKLCIDTSVGSFLMY